jgi:hypothetical protein
LLSLGFTVAALLATGSGPASQDEKTKTQAIEAEGITFEIPTTWKPIQPKSSMRKAQVQIAASAGDAEGADLSLYVFPGGAGGVDANVERWRGQFTDDEGDTPPVETERIKSKNAEVTRVEVAGTFKDPFAPGGPKEGFRLLGAIVITEERGYYFKMVGPDKTIKDAEKDFDAMVASISVK